MRKQVHALVVGLVQEQEHMASVKIPIARAHENDPPNSSGELKEVQLLHLHQLNDLFGLIRQHNRRNDKCLHLWSLQVPPKDL